MGAKKVTVDLDAEKVRMGLSHVIDRGIELSTEIKNADYTDGYHKQVNSEIAALNAVQNSAGKLIVQRAVELRINTLVTSAPLKELD